jgi:hypothetical protein
MRVSTFNAGLSTTVTYPPVTAQPTANPPLAAQAGYAATGTIGLQSLLSPMMQSLNKQIIIEMFSLF